MFCRSCSTYTCIFYVFVGRKVISTSHSSTILKVPLTLYLLGGSDDAHQWIQPCPCLGHILFQGREELCLSLVAGSSWTSGTQSLSHLFLLKGTSLLFFFFFFYNFFYLFLAALCLHCCTQAFSSCGKQGLLFVAVFMLLIAVSSLVVEHRL